MLPPTRDKEKRNLQILKKKTNHKHGQTAGLARPGGFLQSPTQKAEARGGKFGASVAIKKIPLGDNSYIPRPPGNRLLFGDKTVIWLYLLILNCLFFFKFFPVSKTRFF